MEPHIFIYGLVQTPPPLAVHLVGQQPVKVMVHINGMKSFWASLDRGIMGIFHHLSKKHLHRYVSEFAVRLNMRALDTIDLMKTTVMNRVGKRLAYKMLIGRISY